MKKNNYFFVFVYLILWVFSEVACANLIDKSYLNSFEFDTHVVDTGRKDLKADISWFCLDLKFDGNHVKICEFTKGRNTGLRPYTQIINGQKHELVMPLWNFMWRYVQKLNIPVWYVDRYPKNKTNSYHLTERDTIAWDQFLAMGGRHAFDLYELKNFIGNEQTHTHSFNFNSLAAYKEIMVHRRRYKRNPKIKKQLINFKNKYPYFLFLSEVITPYADYKRYGNIIFSYPEIKNYKPRWNYYKKKYTKDLAQKIICDIQSNLVVIKPLDAGHSNGVIVIKKENLDATLSRLFGKNKIPPNVVVNSKRTVSYGYWKRDPNNHFLVEEFCLSKSITHKGKLYDPTMRVSCLVRHDKGKIYVNVLGGFWKIPPKSLSDKAASLTEKHVTVHELADHVGLMIDEQDFLKVKKILIDILPTVYLRMLESHDEKTLDRGNCKTLAQPIFG